MTHSPSQIVDYQLAAYNRRDIEDFCRWFSEDVEIFDLPNPRPSFKGKPEMRELYVGIFAQSPEVHAEVTKRIAMGRFVIDQEIVCGLRGKTIHATAMYEIENQLIRRVWFIPAGEGDED